MVGRKSGRALLREEGLARTDNNLDLTTWPQVNMINQKNYYTEYLKRDDQYLAYRTLHEENTNRMVREARDRDRALAQSSRNGIDPDVEMEEDGAMEDLGMASMQEVHGSRIIVIHPGSQNLRIGIANDALPKTVPMVIARKWKENESEEDGGEPKPKRIKIDNQVPAEPEKWFGEEFATQYATMASELKQRMRNNRRRVLPNSKELVVNYNKRTVPETINEHNDPHRIDWTEVPSNPDKAPAYFTGQAALRIPEHSIPRYKLFWPLRHGWFNEKDYGRRNELFSDFFTILEEAVKTQLGLHHKRDWAQCSCVFVVPDLYERVYVTTVLDTLIRDFGFRRVCFMQESLAATFGAGYSISCIVDVGAQKTSICCVDEGMCVEESRVNLKYGGADVTETFIKMMLFDHFPYEDINLKRRYDWLLAEELKQKFCTMNETDVSVQLYEFHLRASGQDTRKHTFRTYDETMLAPMGYFYPSIFCLSGKLEARHKLVDRSYDLYDGSPNDPFSAAQGLVLQYAAQNLPETAIAQEPTPAPVTAPVAPTPSRPNPFSHLSQLNNLENTPISSVAGSPAPEGTPQPGRGSPAIGASEGVPTAYEPGADKLNIANERDRILPVMPLDMAILASIQQGARGDDRKMRDFFGGIMVIGGGAKIAGFNAFLEERLREAQPGFTKEILIGPPPRELDQQVVVWKGASVFGKLSSSGNDSWVHQKEYDMLGSKLLAQKCMWSW